jgi:hypothetical protein
VSESLFTAQTPALPENTDGAPGITTATTLRFATAGSISAVRFFASTSVGGTYVGLVWRVTSSDAGSAGSGTLLASKTLGTTPTGGTWNNITLDTPVSVVTNTLYRIGLFNTSRYVASTNFFAADVINGNVTADQNTDNPVGLGTLAQGTFVIDVTPGTYPTQGGGGNGTCYFVDVLFDAAGGSSASPTGLSVPVALGSPTVALGRTAAPTGLSVPVALGSPTVGLQVSPTGLAVPVALGSPTVGPTVSTPGAAHVAVPGWWGLLSIGQENAEYVRAERSEPPLACPNDGEPLRQGPNGELWCPWDGWQWNGPGI